MRSEEAVVGKSVRVAAGHRRREFRGVSGTIQERYGDPEYVAVEVEFEDGSRELFWHHELEEVASTIAPRAADGTKRPEEMVLDTPKRGRATKLYWLIVERESFRINVYTLPGEEAVPVFSLQGEAASFLDARGLEGGWQIRETSVGELASLLLGPYACVSWVTLDPPASSGLLAGLVSVDRKDFVDLLMQDSPPNAAEIIAGR